MEKVLQITETESGYTFSGDTYEYRDLIKALPGAKWVPAEKVWTAPKAADLAAIKERMEMLKASYESAAYWAAKNAHLRLPREEWTKEQWRNYCIDWNKRGSPGKCCKNATAFEQYEQGPICWRCERHGDTISNWTGD